VATIEITEENFNDTVKNNETVLIDFWAEWCGPCRNFSPIYEKISNKNPEIIFGKINTENEQGLAQSFNITSIPTIMVIKEGVILYANPGSLGEKELQNLINKVREINMVDVKKSLESKKY
jgi:thioredoxin